MLSFFVHIITCDGALIVFLLNYLDLISLTQVQVLNMSLNYVSVFSDESTIAVLNDRVQTVRRRSGEDFLPDCSKKTVKFPAKIMVWGAISVYGTCRSHIVKGTMNQIKYIEVLEERLLPQLNDWFPDKNYIFQ